MHGAVPLVLVWCDVHWQLRCVVCSIYYFYVYLSQEPQLTTRQARDMMQTRTFTPYRPRQFTKLEMMPVVVAAPTNGDAMDAQ